MKLSRTLWTKLLAIGLGATMALGVGLTASKNVEKEVAAAGTYSAVIDKYNSTAFTTGISDGLLTFGTANNHITTVSNSGSASFTVAYAKNSSSTTSIFNNSAGEIRLYGGSGNGAQLTYTIVGDYVMKSITVNTSTNSGYSIDGGDTITQSGVETSLSDATSTVLKNVASSTAQVRITSVEIGYSTKAAGTATITNGDTLSLKTTDTGITLTGTSSGITSPSYAWSSNNTNVVTVSSGSSTSSVTIQGSGTARVTLTVSGTGGPASDYIDITVSAVVQGISVDVSSTHATTCPLWGTYSPSGLKIKLDNHMGTDPVIDTGFSVSSIDTSSLGPKTVTVTLDADNTKTTTYSVKVTNSGAVVVYNSIASDLIISEYIEGSSNNKAIEIFNGTGASVNLSSYSLKKQNNGVGDWQNATTLSGTLANNNVYVMANSKANATILALANSNNEGVMAFNGNDAVGLFNGTTLVDIVGILNDVNNWGIDTTLVRKSSVTSPSTNYSVSDWDSYATDTITYLGSHTMNTGSVDKSLDQATAYAAFLTTGWAATNFCAHTTTVLTEVNAEYEAMVAGAKTAFNNNGAFAAARANKAYMTSYAASNPKTSAETIIESSRTTLIAATVIGILGLSTLAGFNFLKKKKETF